MKHLQPYTNFSDARGSLIGITQQLWAEVNYVKTVANQTRGGHFHKKTSELFFILSGEINVCLIHKETCKEEQFVAKAGDIFIVDPFEQHTFTTLTDSEWINMLTEAHDNAAPDFFTFEKERGQY